LKSRIHAIEINLSYEICVAKLIVGLTEEFNTARLIMVQKMA